MTRLLTYLLTYLFTNNNSRNAGVFWVGVEMSERYDIARQQVLDCVISTSDEAQFPVV